MWQFNTPKYLTRVTHIIYYVVIPLVWQGIWRIIELDHDAGKRGKRLWQRSEDFYEGHLLSSTLLRRNAGNIWPPCGGNRDMSARDVATITHTD